MSVIIGQSSNFWNHDPPIWSYSKGSYNDINQILIWWVVRHDSCHHNLSALIHPNTFSSQLSKPLSDHQLLNADASVLILILPSIWLSCENWQNQLRELIVSLTSLRKLIDHGQFDPLLSFDWMAIENRKHKRRIDLLIDLIPAYSVGGYSFQLFPLVSHREGSNNEELISSRYFVIDLRLHSINNYPRLNSFSYRFEL